MIAVLLAATVTLLATPFADTLHQQSEPPAGVISLDDEELAAAAQALAEAVVKQGYVAVPQWVDWPRMRDRILANSNVSDDVTAEVRSSLTAYDALAYLEDDIGDEGSLSYLRIVERDGERRARMRAVSTELSVTYHDLLFSRDGKGAARIVDVRSDNVALDISSFLGQYLELARIGDDNPGRIARYLQVMTDVAENPTDEDRIFPADLVTAENAVLLHSIRMSSMVDQIIAGDDGAAAALRSAIDDFERAVPDHASILSRRFELAAIEADIAGGLALVGPLERAYDDPAGADVQRAMIIAEDENALSEAGTYAWRALERDPMMRPAVYFALGAAILTDDFPGIIRGFEHLEEHFGADFRPEDLAANENLAAFVASDEYREWLEGR